MHKMSRDMEKRNRSRRDSPIDYMRAEDIKREKNHKMSYSSSRNKSRKSSSREPDSRRSSKTRTPDNAKELSREYMENIWEMMKRLEDNLGIQSETMTQMSNLVEKMMVSTHNILELEEIRAKNLELKKKIMRTSPSPSIELPIEEEEDRNEDIRVTLLNKASSKWQQPPAQVGPNTRCYRCNKEGHQSPDCPIAEYGLWFCYYCQAVKNHKGNDCPKSDGSYHPKGKRGDRGSYRGKERFQPYHGSKHRDR